MQRFLVSYDISDSRTRNRVFRILKKLGEALQKSVFILDLSESDVSMLKNKLLKLLKESDSLFILPCCSRCYALSVYIGTMKDEAMIA